MYAQRIRTRLAPTPSGFLHIGNALSFVITSGLAGNAVAKVLLRIDDMDRERVYGPYIDDIFDTLSFLGIGWDEGPLNTADFEARFSQRIRLPLYDAALQHLVNGGHVYACTCSRADILKSSERGIYQRTCREKHIPLDSPGVCWRLNTQYAGSQLMHTPGGVEAVSFPADMADFIVRKKDGYPAYQLTSVVDDMHFGIDLIVRGADLYASSIAQLYLAGLLPENSFGAATFYHHPLIADASGNKLSKSSGSTSVSHLRRQGCTAAQVYAEIGRWAGMEGDIADMQQLYNQWQRSYMKK